MKGYWFIVLKNIIQIIDNKDINFLEITDYEYKFYNNIDGKKELLCIIPKENIEYIEWRKIND